jgi:penicillin amidase
MSGITPQKMMELHADYFNITAEDIRPVLLANIDEGQLNVKEREFLEIFRNWDFLATPDSKGQTIFQSFWDTVQVSIWKDEVSRTSPLATWPTEQTTIEWLLRDTVYRYADDINTPQVETLAMTVTTSFKKAASFLQLKEAEGKLTWSRFMNPSLYHLLKDALPAFARKGLSVGGYGNIVNAIKHSHGPSWRMIVHLVDGIEAYGVFPGGQSGNPGSRFYDNNLSVWEKGEYNRCWYMRENDRSSEQVKWVLQFNKS